MARYHSRELKLEVCRQIAAREKRPSQIMRVFSLVDSVLSRWRKEYEDRGELAFAQVQECELNELAKKDLRSRILSLPQSCAGTKSSTGYPTTNCSALRVNIHQNS